jgi:two-component system, cell cycle sensor histidine kinase and response regulator CckA
MSEPHATAHEAELTERTSLHTLLTTLLPQVRAMAGEAIRVTCEPALVDVDVDVRRADLGEAVLALVRNAVTSMPNGGVLTIRTEHVEAAGAEMGPVPPLAPGRYMRITVQDTGRGMDEAERVDALEVHDDDTRGLATVLAVVRRARGALWLDSATALGTRAFLYCPVHGEANAAPRSTVLLVEDEPTVRAVVRRMLLGQGFAVREARDGESALHLWQQERANIIAVMTDVVMPVMGGRDLARELRAQDPAVPILFVSAYAGHEPDLLDGVDAPRQVLGKPFTNEALLQALRALLGTTS